MSIVTRYVAVTNFSRRQPEYDGEPPFVWAGEDVSPAQIAALDWTPDEIEMYLAQGALASFEEYVPEPEPPKFTRQSKQEAQ